MSVSEMQTQVNQLRERLRTTEFETVQFKEQIRSEKLTDGLRHNFVSYIVYIVLDIKK